MKRPESTYLTVSTRQKAARHRAFMAAFYTVCGLPILTVLYVIVLAIHGDLRVTW